MKDVVDNLTMCSLRLRQISNLTLRITAAQLKKNWVFDFPSSVEVPFGAFLQALANINPVLMQFIWTVLWVWQLLLKTNFLILEFKSVASLSGLKGRLNSNEEVSCIIFLLLKFLLLKLMNPAQTLPLSHCYTFILCTSASFLAMTTVKCYAAFRNYPTNMRSYNRIFIHIFSVCFSDW